MSKGDNKKSFTGKMAIAGIGTHKHELHRRFAEAVKDINPTEQTYEWSS